MAYYQVLNAPEGTLPYKPDFFQANVQPVLDTIEKTKKKKVLDDAIKAAGVKPNVKVNSDGSYSMDYNQPTEKKVDPLESLFNPTDVVTGIKSKQASGDSMENILGQLNEAERKVLGLPEKKKDQDGLPASIQRMKIKDRKELTEAQKTADYDLENINQALGSVDKVPSGWMGKIKRGWMENFDPNNPTLADWQKVKGALTDATLLNTAKTKGAISDKEMELFEKASADDDLASSPKMRVALEKLVRFINAELEGKKEAYTLNYGEDPSGQIDSSSAVEDIQKDVDAGSQSMSQFKEGQTATNPKTGEKIVWRGGKWVSQ